MPSTRKFQREADKIAAQHGFERSRNTEGGGHLIYRNESGAQVVAPSTPKTPEFAINRLRQHLRRVNLMSKTAQQEFVDWIVEKYGRPGENRTIDLRIRHVASEFRDETGSRVGVRALTEGVNRLDPRFRMAHMNGPKAATYQILLAQNGDGPVEAAPSEEPQGAGELLTEPEEKIEEGYEKLETAVEHEKHKLEDLIAAGKVPTEVSVADRGAPPECPMCGSPVKEIRGEIPGIMSSGVDYECGNIWDDSVHSDFKANKPTAECLRRSKEQREQLGKHLLDTPLQPPTSLDALEHQLTEMLQKARAAEESTARAELAAELLADISADLASLVTQLGMLGTKVQEAVEALR